jgi:modulator of FtsH protease HflC
VTVVKLNPKKRGPGGLIAVGVAAGLLILGGFLLSEAAYTVHESEQAVVVQFGNPVREVTAAGLQFKVPFIQEVRRFDKRIKAWDGEPNEIPTQGGEFIWVDTTARWRIVKPQLFMESVRDDVSARSRLSDIIDSVVRDQIAGTQLVEIVRSSDWGRMPAQVVKPAAPTDPAPDAPPADGETDELAAPPTASDVAKAALEREELAALTQRVEMGRQELTRRILEKSRVVVEEYGIELVDVQIKRINYVDSVQEQVFKRMVSDQQRRAEEYRSEGQGESARILGEARRELATIRSEAERQAQVIRGEADAEATRVYAEAFNADPEFYAFSRSLESYGKTIDGKSTLLLGTDSEYYRYLKGAKRQ